MSITNAITNNIMEFNLSGSTVDLYQNWNREYDWTLCCRRPLSKKSKQELSLLN